MTFHTLRKIEACEELIVCYIDVFQPRTDRRKELQDNFVFLCECPVCQQSPDGKNKNQNYEILGSLEVDLRSIMRNIRHSPRPELWKAAIRVAEKMALIQEAEGLLYKLERS